MRATLLLALVLPLAPMVAEVRLLTGDANNQPHRNDSFLVDISADGDYLLFASGPPPSGSTPGIAAGGFYVRRLSTDTLEYAHGAGDPVDGLEGSISNDGRYFAWSSANRDVFWRDRQAGTTIRLTSGASNQGRRPIISGDGRYVVFCSTVRDLVADTTKLPASGRWALYRWDSQTGLTEIVSLNSAGGALANGVGPAASGYLEWDYSQDGRYVVFATDSANAHPDAGGNANLQSIYRRDLLTGEVLLISRNAAGTVASGSFTSPRVSANGGRVAFFGAFVGVFAPTRMTTAAPVTFNTDLFVKDVADGAVWWGSRTLDGTTPDAAFSGGYMALSGDGDTLAFGSTGTKFVPQNTDAGGGTTGTFDIFRVDLAPGDVTTTTLISEAPGITRNVDFLYGPLLPGTGDYVAFASAQFEAMLGTGTADNIFQQAIGVGDFSAVAGGGGGVSLAAWAAAAGLSGAGADPLGDPDRDGLRNLLEYALGTDPRVPNRGPVAAVLTGAALRSVNPGLALNDAKAYLTLTVRRFRAHTGVTLTPRAAPSPALLASSPTAVAVASGPVADGPFDVTVYFVPLALADAPALFLDLAASPNP